MHSARLPVILAGAEELASARGRVEYVGIILFWAVRSREAFPALGEWRKSATVRVGLTLDRQGTGSRILSNFLLLVVLAAHPSSFYASSSIGCLKPYGQSVVCTLHNVSNHALQGFRCVLSRTCTAATGHSSRRGRPLHSCSRAQSLGKSATGYRHVWFM